jgi:uncharacterized OsmC-like protein
MAEVMTGESFEVVVGAGSLRSAGTATIQFPHRWTPEGVTVVASFTGAHLLHVAVAGCVLNDLYREAGPLGVELDGVRVSASGTFDESTWRSLGVEYSVELSSSASSDKLSRLLDVVDSVAEIPRALRSGTLVQRTG